MAQRTKHDGAGRSVGRSLGESTIDIRAAKLRDREKQNKLTTNLMTALSAIKPTIVQAQRIMKIIEELDQKLEYESILTFEFLSMFLDLQSVLSKRPEAQKLSPILLKKLNELAIAENEFDTKKGDVTAEWGEDYKPKLRNTIRYIIDRPEEYQTLKSLSQNEKIDEETVEFLEIIRSLRVMTLKRLSTGADEQDLHEKQLKELKFKISEAQKQKSSKEEELRNLQRERAKHTQEKNEQIRALQASQEELKRTEQEKLDSMQRDFNNTREKENRINTEIETKLKDQLAKEKQELKTKVDNNKTAISSKNGVLSQAKSKMKGGIDEYDSQLKKKRAELISTQVLIVLLPQRLIGSLLSGIGFKGRTSKGKERVDGEAEQDQVRERSQQKNRGGVARKTQSY